jgi:hypothetical protein
MTAVWTGLPEPLSTDFRYFLVLVWRHLNLPDPTPIQLDIAHYMQHGSKRRIVEAFRGVGKSWMAAAYVLWLLRLDPQRKIMVVSASKTRADDFTMFCIRLISCKPVRRQACDSGPEPLCQSCWDFWPTDGVPGRLDPVR